MKSPKSLVANALCLLVFFLSAMQEANAQSTSSNSSLDVSMDPRSVALGEASVALEGSTDAFAMNPAALATVTGAWASYSRRGMEWTTVLGLDDMRYREWAAGAATPWGTFSIEYRRQDLGELSVTTPEFPDGGGTAKIYNHVFGIAWGYQISSSLSVGAVAKTFSEEVTYRGLPSLAGSDITTQRPYILDIGILADLGKLFGAGRVADNVSAGCALQNFGTDYRIKSQALTSEVSTQDFYMPLPRTVRIGMAYRLTMHNVNPDGENILQALVLAEYAGIVNSGPDVPDYHWGWGIELTGLELFSIRLGGYFQPYESVYGRDNVVAIRFGAGLHLPLRRIVSDALPLAISLDYTAIPLQSIGFFAGAPATANVFSLGLRYEADLFGGRK